MKKSAFVILLVLFLLSGCAKPAAFPRPSVELSLIPSPLPESPVETGEEKMTPSATPDEGINNNGKRVLASSFDFDTDHFPLYAMIEEDIYLYGVGGNGMILFHNDRGMYFDWPGLTPRFILPQMLYHDFDNDGNRDLAVTLYWGSGTGVSMEDLHIIKIEENPDSWDTPLIYTDYSLSGSDVNDWMLETIIAVLSEDKETLIVDTCGESFIVETLSGYTFESVISGGGVVCFEFEGTQIRTKIGIAALYEELVPPQFFGYMTANVIFDGEGFRLDNYKFTLY